jgi:hypothetical protein
MIVNRTVARKIEAVRGAFAQAQSTDEGGAQLCVYYQGERVVAPTTLVSL